MNSDDRSLAPIAADSPEHALQHLRGLAAKSGTMPAAYGIALLVTTIASC